MNRIDQFCFVQFSGQRFDSTSYPIASVPGVIDVLDGRYTFYSIFPISSPDGSTLVLERCCRAAEGGADDRGGVAIKGAGRFLLRSSRPVVKQKRPAIIIDRIAAPSKGLLLDNCNRFV